jgi:hypothetical protein
MKRILSAVALAALAVSANAQLTFSGGTAQNIVDYNPTGPTNPQNFGLRGSTINASAGGGTLTATFLGFEALDTDRYTFNMGAFGFLTNNTAIAGVTSISGNVAGGALNFTFSDETAGGASVSNGQMGGAPTLSYAVLGTQGEGGGFTPYTQGGLYDLVLGFNDSLNVDGDYDDLVVGLRLNPVPEPETYALMLAGLGAVGFIARRRQKRAAA